MFTLTCLGFDYEDLAELIEKNDLDSIEKVLGKVPDSFLENYTLAYNSRGLHGSSFDSPRAILFGDDAKLIITFNGVSEHHGFKQLEIIQFRESSARFELRAISFQDGVHFSEKNPALCTQCHGADPLPIWPSYAYSENQETEHWPGFYGSIHDAPLLRLEEKNAFVEFRSSAATHPRYKYLKLDHPDSRWFPYGPGPYEHRFRPNNRLGNLLARHYAKWLAKRINQTGFFEQYSNLTWLWLLGCPEDLLATHRESILDLYNAQADHPALHSKVTGSSSDWDRLLSALLTGQDKTVWNLRPESEVNAGPIFTGMVTIHELVAAHLLDELPDDYWLRDYYRPWTQEQLYDTFKVGYYAQNVAPGGVGAAYQAAGPFYDRDYARLACPILSDNAMSELSRSKG